MENHIKSYKTIPFTGTLSPDDLSAEMLEEIIQYTLTKADTTMPLGLTFYYRSGGLSRTVLQQAIAKAVPRELSSVSLVPVLAVEDAHTLVAVTATRH